MPSFLDSLRSLNQAINVPGQFNVSGGVNTGSGGRSGRVGTSSTAPQLQTLRLNPGNQGATAPVAPAPTAPNPDNLALIPGTQGFTPENVNLVLNSLESGQITLDQLTGPVQYELNARSNGAIDRFMATGSINGESGVQSLAALGPTAGNPVNTPSILSGNDLNASIDVPDFQNTLSERFDLGFDRLGTGEQVSGAGGVAQTDPNQKFQSDFLRNERLKTGAAFLGALSGGVQAYTGLQQLDLAKESFRFNRNLARVNLANQTKLANLEIGERNLARSGKGQSSLSNAEAVDRVGLVGKV